MLFAKHSVRVRLGQVRLLLDNIITSLLLKSVQEKFTKNVQENSQKCLQEFTHFVLENLLFMFTRILPSIESSVGKNAKDKTWKNASKKWRWKKLFEIMCQINLVGKRKLLYRILEAQFALKASLKISGPIVNITAAQLASYKP